MTDPIIKRGTINTSAGVEVDELDLTLLCNSDVTVGNVPLAQFARQGGFDGARLSVTRQFSLLPGSTACGSLNLFSGRVSTLTVSGSSVDMTVRSDLELLDEMMPRNIYMAQCQHTLFDTGCNISASSFVVSGNTSIGSTTSNIHSNLSQADGYFELGVIKFTTGANAGVSRTVRIYASGVITPVQPLNAAPAAGDLFQIRPGCDKLLTTCTSKFNNAANYRGYQFIPAPEQTY